MDHVKHLLEKRIERGIRLENILWNICVWLLTLWFCTWISAFIVTGLRYFVPGNMFMNIVSLEFILSTTALLCGLTVHVCIQVDEKKLKKLNR